RRDEAVWTPAGSGRGGARRRLSGKRRKRHDDGLHHRFRPAGARHRRRSASAARRVGGRLLLFLPQPVSRASVRAVLRVVWMKASTKRRESRSTMVGASALSMKKDR